MIPTTKFTNNNMTDTTFITSHHRYHLVFSFTLLRMYFILWTFFLSFTSHMFIVTFLLMLSPQMIKCHSQYSGWQRLKRDISLLTRNMTTKWNKISILCRVHSSSDHAHSSSALSRFDDVFVPCSVFDNIQTSTKSILLFLYFSFQTFLTKD